MTQPTDTAQSAAPFTPDEIVNLAEFQRGEALHPFTCPNRGDPDHRGEGELVPTVRGWICPFCDYTQNWAHGFMLNGSAVVNAQATMKCLRARLNAPGQEREAEEAAWRSGPSRSPAINSRDCSHERDFFGLGFRAALAWQAVRAAAPASPPEWRCRICGGLVTFDGTAPSGETDMRGRHKAAPASTLTEDVIRLVVAARAVAFGDMPPDAGDIKELDAASEAFADRVPWEDEPK